MEAHIELAYHLGFYFFNFYSKYKDKIHYNIKKKKKGKKPPQTRKINSTTKYGEKQKSSWLK